MESKSVAPPSVVARLTLRMARGDEEAFREFHAAYFGRLFRYVLVLMRGDEHSARDVAQETLLRVVRYVRRFEDAVIFWDWLARLARSAAADHGRHASRYRQLLEVFARQPPELSEPMPEGECPSALINCLNALDADDRALLAQKYEERSSVRQLALAHRVTEEAIESRLARARRLLREAVFRHLRHEKP
jgi:RNA polymerase sigma-70 factor (ECF subfamily)